MAAAAAGAKMVFSYGSWVWIPDEDDMFVPAKVQEAFEAGKPGKVSRDGGSTFTLEPKDTALCQRMDEQSLSSINNMVELKELNEASILHNLRLRFKQDDIYTTVGSILVSVNPFKLLNIYTNEMLERYKNTGSRANAPHVYGVADNAYKSMVSDNKNQSCIVSGESGAGKTEATKIFLQYIADISGAAKGKAEGEKDPFGKASLQEQILKANPLMEAFGNAKTKRNNNSSRFGKWIEVKFNNKRGNIVGGSIVQYLLEKSRLVHQAEGERNYHIFYQLAAGSSMDNKVKEKFKVGEPDSYHYLNQSGVMQVDGINDERDWEDVCGAMEVIGISNAEQDDILMTVAGILHLGNVEFEGSGGNEDGSKVTNDDVLALAAKQLGSTPEVLGKALCYRVMTTGKDTVAKVNNVEQAGTSRDALAKQTYAQLFEWLINRINVSLAGEDAGKKGSASKDPGMSIIGVLDIFGFETFAWNSFEQLCINYCNEKLQFHFNEHIFSLEQKEYKSEGIDVSQISFADNQPTLTLLEEKAGGVFSMIDEEMTVPRGTDETLLGKLAKKHEKHPSFRKPGVKTNYERASFTVVHYAGAVMYNVTGFLEKNKDKLSDDLEEVCLKSSRDFVSILFGGGPTAAKSAGGNNRRDTQAATGSKNSIGLKFKNQLASLMTTLNATEPHFVRCIKPNDEKLGGRFSSQMVIEQLRYAGLLEVCRIRQIGYPIRKEFKDFHRRYNCLVGNSTKDAKALCAKLESESKMRKGNWQIGKNKVFMRNNDYNDLEALREVALKAQAILLQSVARRFIQRCRYVGYKKALNKLKEAIKARAMDKLKEALSDVGDIPNQGKHLPVVAEGNKLLKRLEEEEAVAKLLQDAIKKRDYNLLQGAIGNANDMKFASPVVNEAIALVKKIEEERAAVKALSAAIEGRELGKLVSAMDIVKAMNLTTCNEWKQAEALKARLEEEKAVTDALKAAAASKDIDKISAALEKAQNMGLKNAAVDEAEKAKKDIFEEIQSQDQSKADQLRMEDEKKEKAAAEQRQEKVDRVKKELEEATASDDQEKIERAKEKVLELGVTGKEVEKLLESSKKHNATDEVEKELKACVETLANKMKSGSGIKPSDTQNIEAALKKAKESDVPDSNEFVERAAVQLKKAKEQLSAQSELRAVLDNPNAGFEELRAAMEHAQEVDMETDDYKAVLDRVRDLDEGRKQEHKKREEVEMDEDEFERQRKENMAMASHERYNFKKYYKVRTDGDFVKNSFFNKKKATDAKLTYQKTIIPRSILQLDKELNKSALGVHKSILGYCGEQLMSFPATLAQDILIKGLEQPDLVDEIFVQICKHLTNNPKPESVGRAWQLMCMSVGTFPPSQDFEYYLMNFLIEHLQVPGLVGNYARYSLRRLEGMLIRGASGFVPNIDEILAYKERPPILATIELVDGTPLTEDLPITPDLNVEKVLEICVHFLSLADPRKVSFGIFVKDSESTDLQDEDFLAQSGYSAARNEDDEPQQPQGRKTESAKKGAPAAGAATASGADPGPPRTPRPLRSKDFLGDVVVQMTRQRRAAHFVFKRKVFLPNQDQASTDPVYSRLMYLQAADEIISGNIPVIKEADVVDLTALAVAADSEKFPATEKALIDADLMEYIPVPWRSKKTDANWARAVLAARGKVAAKSLDVLQNKYVETVKAFPLWGMCFFFVRKEQSGPDMICGISHEGITFLSTSRVVLQAFKYADVHRWGGSSTQFWLLVWDGKRQVKSKMALFTSQARDMSSLILDYALLAAEKKGGTPGAAGA